jgi:radical SAM protein with 4Fe4S-binding SPASM domain
MTEQDKHDLKKLLSDKKVDFSIPAVAGNAIVASNAMKIQPSACLNTGCESVGCSRNVCSTTMCLLPFGNVFQGITWIDNRKHCLNDSIDPRRKCQGCDYEKDCGGGCPATNFAYTGSVYIPGDEECKIEYVVNSQKRQIQSYR